MRLIDADALWSNLAKYFVEMKKRRDLLPYGEERKMRNREIDGFREALYHIKDATIDAVPVVRCKDCKHMAVVGVGFRWCKAWERMQTMGDDGFCCFGERRSDD